MADLTQTAANVALTDTAGADTEVVQAGEAITQGMPVYQQTANSKWFQCDADLSQAAAAAQGIALTPAGADEDYFVVAKDGSELDVGATLTVGESYYVSDTKGGIKPAADLTTGDFPCLLGIARTASALPLNIVPSSVAKP